MSVWDCVVGQEQAVQRLRAAACGDSSALAQSWLICGAEGFGAVTLARAFAAALESPDHGESEGELSQVAREVLAGSHPDVNTLSTDAVTISIDDVREIVSISEQMPSTAYWRIIIIEDIQRMLERSTNVLLKEIEEPSPHTIWILCASSVQDVLPTIRSRTQIVQLTTPDEKSVAKYIADKTGADKSLSNSVARIAQGNLQLAELYASDERALSRRNELVYGLLHMRAATDAVILAGNLIDDAKAQAETEVQRWVEAEQDEFRRINGLTKDDRMPSKLRAAYNAIGKKDEVKRKVTRTSRDVLNRALNAVESVYRDILIVLNNAQESSPIINQDFYADINKLAKDFTIKRALLCVDEISKARRRLVGNGNPTLVFEALFCALLY